MATTVYFKTVSTNGLESSPVSPACAGLRAKVARYIEYKYKVPYVAYPVRVKPDSLAVVQAILSERELHIAAKPL